MRAKFITGGAVVEGTWSADGYFRASLILAKHSE